MRKQLLAFVLVFLGLFTIAITQPVFAADANTSNQNAEDTADTQTSDVDSPKNQSENSNGYWRYFSAFDYFIVTLGILMFIWQIIFLVCYCKKIYWATQHADYISELHFGVCEVFPLLGLLGTVLGLLNTFNALPKNSTTDMSNVISELLPKFAPALTTTVSGMFSMIFNLLLCVISCFIIKLIARGGK